VRGLAILLAVAAIAALLAWRGVRGIERAGRDAAVADGPGGTPPSPPPEPASGAEVKRLASDGRIRDREGTPIAHASVVAVDGPETTTDREGRFALEVDASGPWLLVARARGYAPCLDTIHAPERNMALVLVRGRRRHNVVVDDAGRAVPDASIGLVHTHRTGPVVPVARTDDDGRFALRARGSDRLVVRADGFATRCVRSGIRRIVLSPGTHVGGAVVDTAGEPAAGARVTIAPDDLPPQRTRSGADGRFLFTMIPPDHGFGDTRLSVAAPGYAEERLTAVPGDTGLSVVLRRTASLGGIVVRADGSPAAHFMVYMELAHPERDRHAATGTDGRFRAAGLRPGRWRVEAHSGTEPYRSVRADVEIGEGAAHELRLELNEPATSYVTLRVVDGTGRPRAQVGTVCRHEGRNRSRTRATGDDGRSRHALPLPPGTRVEVRFRSGNPRVTHHARATTTARPDEREIEVVMPARARVEIAVTDEDGRPAHGAKATIGNLATPAKTANTWLVDPGRPFVVEVEAEGRARIRERFEAPGPGAHRIEIPLPGKTIVTGRVVAPDGAPTPAGIRGYFETDGLGHWFTAHTGEDGRFALPALPPGRVRLHFGRPATRVEASATLDLAAGETRDLGDVRLSGMRTLHGRVLDGSGRPLPGARIQCHADWRGWHHATADRERRYDIRVPLYEGTFLVVARPRYGAKVIPFADGAPGPRLDVRLPPEGRVIARAGEPVERIDFDTALDVASGVRWKIRHQAIERGPARVVVGSLPPGRARLRFRLHGPGRAREIEREVDVPAGGTVEIDLD